MLDSFGASLGHLWVQSSRKSNNQMLCKAPRQQLAKNIFEMHLMPTTPLQVGQLQQQLALHALTEAQLKAEYRARVQQLAEAADRRAAAERDLEERVEGLEAELSEARGRAAAVEQQLAHVELKSGRLEEER